MPLLISLGFSCQSKLLLESVSNDSPSMPFDWNITTKEFILSELSKKDGSGFYRDVSELEMHRMPGELIEGLGKDGIFFWHDFPRTPDQKALRADYHDYNDLGGKYRYLWARFLAAVTNEAEPKRFIVSNTQANLVEYASSPEDFDRKFRIDSTFTRELRDRLSLLGARNYDITYLVRTMEEYLELSSHRAHFESDVRFVGPLSLPVKDVALAAMLAGETSNTAIENLSGKYDNGMGIVQSSSSSAILYDTQKQALAVARAGRNSYTFCFRGGVDGIVFAVKEGESLRFPSGASWRRTSA